MRTFIDPRKSKGKIARTLAVAVGAVAVFAGAVAAPMAASAAEIDAITSVKITGVDPNVPLDQWQSFDVEAEWAVPDGTLEGDSFTLAFQSPPMVAYAGVFDLVDNGNVAAHCTATQTQIHCVFTDYVETHKGVHGTLSFRAQASQEYHEGEIIFTLNDEQEFEVPVPGGGINPGVPGPAPTEPDKQSWQDTDGKNITWRIILPGDQLAKVNGKEVLFEDSYDSRLTLDESSLYVARVKASEWEMNKDESIPSSPAPGTPGTYTFEPDAANHSFKFWFNEPIADASYIYIFAYKTPLPAGVKVGDVFSNTVTANGQDYLTDNQNYVAPSGTVTGNGIVPKVDIEKGDGANGAIVHDADTEPEAETYQDGEKREIVFVVTNTGDENLRNVELTDKTLSGTQVTAITWTFPDGTTATSTLVNGVWTARWEATFGTGTEKWAPGAVIKGTATLTLDDTVTLHSDSATVNAVGAATGTPVTDTDDYHAKPTPPTPSVDIEKGDGPDGEIEHDADTLDDAESYAAGETRLIQFIVKNNGTEGLRNVELTDKTVEGAQIKELEWTFPDGTTAKATLANGVWSAKWDATFTAGGAVWAPGDVILGTATLTLDGTTIPHTDAATVNAVGVASGTPVTDTDEYHALPPAPPFGSPNDEGDDEGDDNSLPYTGMNANSLIPAGLAGGLALLLGIGAVIVARRKRQNQG